MDKSKNLIAVASSDGIVVNSHFGKATTFYIYEEKEEQIRYVETRKVEPVCSRGNHDDIKLRENLEKFSDCKYLLVSRIGMGAATKAESLGIAVYEIPGMIEESIQRLLRYEKIKNLF
jgi:predicted Fe-Mo cluster-binding NifX family protein